MIEMYKHLILWCFSSISLTITYRIFSHYYRLNALLTCLSLFCQSIIGMLYTMETPKFLEKSKLMVILSQGTYILLSNLSLQYIPIHCSVMFKCLIPFFTIIFSHLINFESPDWKTCYNTIVIISGMFLTNYNPDKNYIDSDLFLGYIIAFLASLVSSLRFSVLKKYMAGNLTLSEPESEESGDKKIHLVVVDTYFYMSLMILPFSIVTSINQTFQDIPIFLGFLIVTTLLGYFLSIGEFNVLNKTSVYMTILFEILKETVLIVSSSFFEESFTVQNWIGVLIVLSTIFDYKISNS